jgi:hypothetical protein
MNRYQLFQVSDGALALKMVALVARDRATTAELLAHISEFDVRRLYAPQGYPSMHAYCVGELRLSDDAAFKRIRAARAGREFPAIFDMVADGRLHLAAVVMLKPCLTHENADDLLAAATHRTKAEIEHLLAQRFPQPDVPGSVRALAPQPAAPEQATGPVEAGSVELAPGPVQAAGADPSQVPGQTLAPARNPGEILHSPRISFDDGHVLILPLTARRRSFFHLAGDGQECKTAGSRRDPRRPAGPQSTLSFFRIQYWNAPMTRRLALT